MEKTGKQHKGLECKMKADTDHSLGSTTYYTLIYLYRKLFLKNFIADTEHKTDLRGKGFTSKLASLDSLLEYDAVMLKVSCCHHFTF